MAEEKITIKVYKSSVEQLEKDRKEFLENKLINEEEGNDFSETIYERQKILNQL